MWAPFSKHVRSFVSGLKTFATYRNVTQLHTRRRRTIDEFVDVKIATNAHSHHLTINDLRNVEAAKTTLN